MDLTTEPQRSPSGPELTPSQNALTDAILVFGLHAEQSLQSYEELELEMYRGFSPFRAANQDFKKRVLEDMEKVHVEPVTE